MGKKIISLLAKLPLAAMVFPFLLLTDNPEIKTRILIFQAALLAIQIVALVIFIKDNKFDRYE